MREEIAQLKKETASLGYKAQPIIQGSTMTLMIAQQLNDSIQLNKELLAHATALTLALEKQDNDAKTNPN